MGKEAMTGGRVRWGRRRVPVGGDAGRPGQPQGGAGAERVSAGRVATLGRSTVRGRLDMTRGHEAWRASRSWCSPAVPSCGHIFSHNLTA